LLGHTANIAHHKCRLPMNEVVGACISRRRAPATQRQILEELNAGSGLALLEW
jgi:hypothetical protein